MLNFQCISYDIPSTKSDKDDLFHELGTRIRNGQLVAFPTETVYGLGANALDARAVLNIFTTKGRPLTDPVICHVADAASGLKLIELHKSLIPVYLKLTDSFWPGPLSLVGKAVPAIPSIVTANTGSVAVRCPKNDIALDLIRSAGVPIAAPSANKFGCISPTSWHHVSKAFKDDNVAVLKGSSCSVGIESTVAKLVISDNDVPSVIVLRVGAVTVSMMQKVLHGLVQPNNIRLSDKISSIRPVSKQEAEDSIAAVAEAHGAAHEQARKVLAALNGTDNNYCSATNGIEETGEEAPGMLLTHYAPSVPTYLLKLVGSSDGIFTPAPVNFSESLLVDVFATDRNMLSDNSRAQFADVIGAIETEFEDEMLASGCDEALSFIPKETRRAAQVLFGTMHEADDVAKQRGLKAIYLLAPPWMKTDVQQETQEEGLDRAIMDRLYRASSGRLYRAWAVGDNLRLFE